MAENQAMILRRKMLGALVRDARQDSGKTLREASELIGSSSAKFSSFEKGRRSISLPELEVLAFQLGVPLGKFISGGSSKVGVRPSINPTMVITLRQKMIGAMLRAHRQEAGLSMKELATRAGIPSSRVGAYERGERAVPFPELEDLLQSLGQNVFEYLNKEGPVGEWHIDQDSFEVFKALPPDLRKFLGEADNERYLRLAKRMSEISVEKLRNLAESLLDITL
jgi:transcriptional regulator with XRE-family HTH domain